LKPPSSVSGSSSTSGVWWLAHQTSQMPQITGIFSTTSRKKMGQNPVTAPV